MSRGNIHKRKSAQPLELGINSPEVISFGHKSLDWTNDLMLKIEIEEETDGRFIAEVPSLPGVMAYGRTREEAVANVEVLALRTLADRVEQGEPVPELPQIFSAA